MPDPNEILSQWESEDDLLRALSHGPIGPLGQANSAPIHAVSSRVDFDGADTVQYDFALRDGRGEPLRYPILLVSATAVEEATSRGEEEEA